LCGTEVKGYIENDENNTTESSIASFDIATPFMKSNVYSSNSSAETSMRGIKK